MKQRPSWKADRHSYNQEITFYGIRRFIIMFTSVWHWALYYATYIQSTSWHPISLRSILILSSHLRAYVSEVTSSLQFFNKTLYVLFLSHACYIWAGLLIQYSDWLRAERLDDRGSIPGGGCEFFLRHHVQTGSGSHPASYPMGNGGGGCLSLGVKWRGHEADHSPPSSAEVKKCSELYFHSPNMPSWRGAKLKRSTGTTLPTHAVINYFIGLKGFVWGLPAASESGTVRCTSIQLHDTHHSLMHNANILPAQPCYKLD
jgi:hypothetical protein